MCLNPLKGFISKKGYIISVKKNNVVALRYNHIKSDYEPVYNTDDIMPDDITEYIDMPCRSCPECYAQTRREWISRAVAEAQMHDRMCFLTLTYDDNHVPVAEMPDMDGVLMRHQTLQYRDFQLFMKRLRKHFKDVPIRFMCCGEYGSKTYRPHYHAILYGIGLQDFPDLIVHNKNSQGDLLYISKILDSIWQKGYILIGDCNVMTISYVAGYVDKKSSEVKGKRFYEITGVCPPFIRSSLRPGLGSNWFQSSISKFDTSYDYVSVNGGPNGSPYQIRLTPTWKRKYEALIANDSTFEEIIEYEDDRVDRRVRLFDHRFENLDTDMSKEEYYYSRNADFRNRCKRKRGVY